MPNPTRPQMSGKRKKKQWISTLHQELLKGLNFPLRVHLPGKKQFGEQTWILGDFFMMHAFLPML